VLQFFTFRMASAVPDLCWYHISTVWLQLTAEDINPTANVHSLDLILRPGPDSNPGQYRWSGQWARI